MAEVEDFKEQEQDHLRRERLEDGRIAIVRIRHRLQKIQDEMEQINRRLDRARRRGNGR